MNNAQYNVTQIQIRHHRQTLDCRAQDRVVQSSVFAEAWTFATHKQREEVLEYLDILGYRQVKNWALKIMIGTLDRCSMITLRKLARYHQIVNYSRLSKTELINKLNLKGVKDDRTNLDGSN